MSNSDNRLFNRKTLDSYVGNDSIPEKHAKNLSAWVRMIEDGTARRLSEVQLHSEFNSKIVQEVLGYCGPGSGAEFTVASEYKIGRGAVDLALGRFGRGGVS